MPRYINRSYIAYEYNKEDKKPNLNLVSFKYFQQYILLHDHFGKIITFLKLF